MKDTSERERTQAEADEFDEGQAWAKDDSDLPRAVTEPFLHGFLGMRESEAEHIFAHLRAGLARLTELNARAADRVLARLLKLVAKVGPDGRQSDGASFPTRYFNYGEIDHMGGFHSRSKKKRPNRSGWFYFEPDHCQWAGPFRSQEEGEDDRTAPARNANGALWDALSAIVEDGVLCGGSLDTADLHRRAVAALELAAAERART